MDITETVENLRSTTNVRFRKLLMICKNYFEEPRISGSHHIFKTPWPGDPRINLQEEKGCLAKPYQVRQVIQALQQLKEQQDDGKI